MAGSQALTSVTSHIDQLLAQLREHEEAAATIRAAIADLKKRLAAAGKRAGPKARSGKRRRAEGVAASSDDRLDVAAASS